MADYEKMYHKAFNALTDVHEAIYDANSIMLDMNNLLTDMRARIWHAERLIAKAQETCEDIYLDEENGRPKGN